MKKYFCLLGTLLLVGCSSQNRTPEPTTAAPQIVESDITQEESTVLPTASESVSETASIPDKDGLLDKVVDVLIELNATDASIDSWERHLDASEPNMKAIYSLPDGKKFVVDCYYNDLTKHWMIPDVYNLDNPDITYYVYGHDDYYDIYDLRTDELIKESKRAFDESEFMSEAESLFESISDEGNAKLESIAEKYKTN